MSKEYNDYIYDTIRKASPTAAYILQKEMQRQERTVELIASENFPSDAALAACGSIMSCKYTEGYPRFKELGNSGRYYGGCENYDLLENYGIKVFQQAFNTDYYFNLQPHSGSNANCIAYSALIEPGDRILSMGMNSGAHLTHNSPVSFVSKLYAVSSYETGEDGLLDCDEIEAIAKEVRPKLIICGASAYPRTINYEKFAEIAHKIDAYLVADIAHISGLIIAGDHPSPFGYADIVTFTTQKMFRSIRGGVVACKPELAKKVDSSCFPRWQGGALQNAILGKVISAEEACRDEYVEYVHQVKKNAKAMCDEFIKLGYDVVTGGTDTHMILLDFSKTHPNLTGLDVQNELDMHDITLNKNCVPNERRSPKLTSGVRIGTPAMTTKGWKENDFIDCARKIDEIIKGMVNQS